MRSQLSNGFQLALGEAHPRRVVRVGIDDCAHPSGCEVALHLRAKLLATIVVHVERLILHPQHLRLHLLHGEAGVDEQDGVFPSVGLRTGEERGKRPLHGAAHGDASVGIDVDVDEGFHEARRLSLQLGHTLDVGIGTGDAVLQGFHLSIDANLCGRQPGDAHLQLDKLYPTLLFSHGSHMLHLADGSLGKIVDAELCDKTVDEFSLNWCLLHSLFQV